MICKGGIKTVHEINLALEMPAFPIITPDPKQQAASQSTGRSRSGGDEMGPRSRSAPRSAPGEFPGGYPVVASPPRTIGAATMSMHKATPPSKAALSFRGGSQSARTVGVYVPSQLAAPRHRNKLTTLGGVSSKWHREGARRPTDDFLSPGRRTRHAHVPVRTHALTHSRTHALTQSPPPLMQSSSFLESPFQTSQVF